MSSQKAATPVWKTLTVPLAEVTTLFAHFENTGYHRLRAMWSIRAVLSGTLESLILTDRFLYLMEHEDFDEIALILLFDPLLSPRNMELFAKRRRIDEK